MNYGKWLRCAAGMIALAAAACASPTDVVSLDEVAEGYVRATLRLAQHQPDLVEGWSGPEAWRPGPREPVGTTHARIVALAGELERIPAARVGEPARLSYLRGQIAALDLAARRLLGESTSFAEETRRAFALKDAGLPAGDAADLSAALAAVLPGTGPIRERHAAFRSRFLVTPDRREPVLQAALDACRDATRAHVAMPEGEAIRLRFDVDTPWDGLARYDGHHRSTIDVSSRGSLDVSRAVTLACHEGYPGHHLQHLLVHGTLLKTQGWMELRLAPRFGPHVLVTEGAAEAGVDLAMPREAKLQLYRDRLFPIAGLPRDAADALVEVEERVRAADVAIPATIGAYLDSRASREATIEALGDLGVLEPESFLVFAERRRTLATVYPIGRRLVGHYLRAESGSWTRLAALFTTTPFALP